MHRPRSNFMEDFQRDITQSMRGILVDWLVEVSPTYFAHFFLFYILYVVYQYAGHYMTQVLIKAKIT